MLKDKEYSESFEEACTSYGGIRILLNLVNKQETPNICKMVATFSRQGWTSKEHFRAIAYHEVAHPSYMPEWYEDHIKYIALLKYIFIDNKNNNLNDLIYISNIIYDMMVDRHNQLKFKTNLRLLVDSVLKDLSYSELDKAGTLYKLLICYYDNCLNGKSIVSSFYEFNDNTKKSSLRCLNVVDSKISKIEKVKKIAFIINTLFAENGENINDAIEDLKESSLDMVNGKKPETSNKNNDPLADALENGDIDEELFDFLFDKENEDKDSNKVDEKILQTSENGSDYLESVCQWIKEAKKNVSIVLKKRSKVSIKGVGKNKNGLMVRSGIWNENNNIQELDMLSTLSSHSFFIPGEYAVKKSIVSDSIKNKSKKYNLHIVMDTSGSIPAKTGSIIIFTLIEAARLNRNNVSVSLFHDKQYYEKTIVKSLKNKTNISDGLYERFCLDIAKKWENGSTDLSTSFDFLKSIKNKFLQCNKDDNLVIVITDFADNANAQTKIIMDINAFSKISKVLIVSIGDTKYLLDDLIESCVPITYTENIHDCSLKCLKNIEI